MKDRWGQEIEVGVVILYPQRKLADLWIQDALVTEVRENGIGVLIPRQKMVIDNDTQRVSFQIVLLNTTLQSPERATVLPHISAAQFKEAYLGGKIVTRVC